MHIVESDSFSETENIGSSIGGQLKGGEVIELISDLGGGKTTFVRGLARGMGSADHVSSPTFKLNNIYKANSPAGELELHHYDFYRLDEAGIVADELAEVINQPNAVVVVEWGEVVQDVLPAQRLTVNLKVVNETERSLILKYPATLIYLIERIKII